MPVYTHTHIRKPFEDNEPVGLKVDIAWFFSTESQYKVIYIYIYVL